MEKYYEISEQDLGLHSKIPLLKLGSSGEVYYELALEMIKCIQSQYAQGKKAVIICPVGPVGHYPIFVRLVKQMDLSLKDCIFINMDEYLNDDHTYICMDSNLSFRKYMQEHVYDALPAHLSVPDSQRFFPDPACTDNIQKVIDKFGGVDLVIGGIGINGHLAFNEANAELSAEIFASLPTRIQKIAAETRTANAIADLGGAVDSMPKYCVTVGMKEILSAKKIRLGVFRDWHRSVIRRAAYGKVSSEFGASLLQNHTDVCIFINDIAAKAII